MCRNRHVEVEIFWLGLKTLLALTCLLFIVTGCKKGGLLMPSCSKGGDEERKLKVALYSGKGASLARDVEKALKILDIPYDKIEESDMKSECLPKYSVMIIPGGLTGEMVSGLKGLGYRSLREYVKNGGGFIGICAGAYLAPKRVNISGYPEGLGIIDIENERLQGLGMHLVRIEGKHPVTKGYESQELPMFRLNGPMMIPGKSVEVLAKYVGDNDFAAIVTSKYGEGRVVLFGVHPEGSIEHKVDPEELGTTDMLKNAIEFASD